MFGSSTEKKGVHERLLRRCFRRNSAEFGLLCHMKRVCMYLCVNCEMKSDLENEHALIFLPGKRP